MRVLPAGGSLSLNVATGRSSSMCRTAIPDVASVPTRVAGSRVPSDSTAVMVLAPSSTEEGVTMIPPGWATTPVPITVLPCPETTRRTVERRTFDSVPARCRRSTTTATVPGSVVGTMVGTRGVPGSGEPVVAMVTPVATTTVRRQSTAPPSSQRPGTPGWVRPTTALDRPVRRLGGVAPEPVVGRDPPAHRPLVLTPVVVGTTTDPALVVSVHGPKVTESRPARGVATATCTARASPGPTPGLPSAWPYDDGVARDLAIDLGTANTLVFAKGGDHPEPADGHRAQHPDATRSSRWATRRGR